MIIYCEQLIGNELTDASQHGKDAQYQILYSNFGTGNEKFSMNYFNLFTKSYVNVKTNTKLYNKGLKYARNCWNSKKELIKNSQKEIKAMKQR